MVVAVWDAELLVPVPAGWLVELLLEVGELTNLAELAGVLFIYMPSAPKMATLIIISRVFFISRIILPSVS